ncbi:MAG TPA: maleylpyruvate isomerase N-terminal domain-containing protein, partial [Mycobacterium sp.]|nr:maleylpyruvate isomerase N-terminal domain-containing protein [Mycobacterium sp.]
MTIDRVGAAWAERAALLRFCRDLGDAEWQTPSAATGWRVQDVVAHMGSSCHEMLGPGVLEIIRSKDIESSNDVFVDRRRDWSPGEVLSEYERWSSRALRLTGFTARTPLARAPMKVGELGRFPFGQMLGALVFDTHIHLRHDIAPVLDRPAPTTDANRIAVV